MKTPEEIKDDQAQKLLETDPVSLALMSALRRVDEKILGAAAEAYVERARELGASSSKWRVDKDRINDARYAHGDNWAGPLPSLMRGVKRIAAVKALCAAGANPWGKKFKQENKEWQFSSAEEMAYLITYQHDIPAAIRTALFPVALLHVPESAVKEFTEELLLGYQACTSDSSKLSAGVLGAKDKQARDAAKLWVENEDGLRRLAGKASSDTLAKMEKSLVDAAERLLAKNSKANLAMSPAKMKKSMTETELRRIGALSTLLTQFGRDDPLIEAAFGVTDWLEEKSMALALRLPHHGCLMYQAMTMGSLPAMRAIESAGANIWLASAQLENANACDWAARSAQCQDDEMLTIIARMLLNGAALNGAADPKSYCVELAQKAVAQSAQSSVRDRASQLLARLEAFHLASELRQELCVSDGEEPAPKRRNAL